MFEKLITDLKKSLPESLRKKLGGAEMDDDELQEEEGESEDSDAASSSDEEKKKKRNSMIIKVIIILGIGYYVVDEYVLKTSEPTVEELLAKAPKRKRPKPVKPAAADATATTADAGTATTTPETTPETDPNATTTAPDVNVDASSGIATSTAEVPPIENVNVLDKSAETSTTTTSTPTSEPESPPLVTETRVGESNVDQKLDQLVDNVEQTAPTSPIEEIKIPSHTESPTSSESSAPSMASKIVEGITETPPPAYDQLGRGLVYNCKDKYWACLDKPAYVTCNKNMKWNKSKGNAAECAVSNIYGSEEDCAKVQKYNVSTNASTDICN
ncbi:hypothetical protein SHI21_03405 [Bacteriovorax sp. PP10]|uniref:Chitin-binding type-2 domain-containing protein n=1 Tax=Bacteriovorax antarcticus TaxID=3088717 RepID=A0ABU5VQA4_9BACT|nr:hypothetical protein [Bacteriovorax sp. PP10]MEA9355228.1 hypothetical protein [Bacteriovorax sp. PP10]